MRFKDKILVTILIVTATIQTAAKNNGDIKTKEGTHDKGWLIGIKGGALAGESDFSSFAADRFRPGWNAGINGGYRFNSILSVEAFAQWGEAYLAEQSCCSERNYWLYTEEWRRSVLQQGHGAYFNNILSSNFLQRYGLQMNVNLLGFGHPDRSRRLRLEISPAISAVGSSTDLILKDSKEHFYENIKKWHMGMGSDLQISYAIAQNIDLGIYGGFTYLTGRNFDAIPELHSHNFLYDAGIKLTYNLRKSKKARKTQEKPAQVPPAAIVPVADTDRLTVADTVAEIKPTAAVDTAAVVEPVAAVDTAAAVEPTADVDTVAVMDTVATSPIAEVESATSQLDAEFAKNTIYFSFNSIWIEPGERDKVKEIARILKANPDVRVRVTGWGCSIGTVEQNLRVSLQRAEGVKRVLGQWLIPADRIETAGAGIKYDAPTKEEARCAVTIEIIEKQ